MVAVSDATAEFFERLSSRGHDERFESVTGTIRFELANDEKADGWLVSIARGDIDVSRKRGAADCTVRAPTDVLDAVVRGEQNAMAAVLRGAVAVEGDSKILVRFQRLFPSPPAQ